MARDGGMAAAPVAPAIGIDWNWPALAARTAPGSRFTVTEG